MEIIVPVGSTTDCWRWVIFFADGNNKYFCGQQWNSFGNKVLIVVKTSLIVEMQVILMFLFIQWLFSLLRAAKQGPSATMFAQIINCCLEIWCHKNGFSRSLAHIQCIVANLEVIWWKLRFIVCNNGNYYKCYFKMTTMRLGWQPTIERCVKVIYLQFLG